MAARYRKIDPRIWDDEKFVTLPAPAKLVTFHVITSQSNRCGIFKYSKAHAVEQTGLKPDTYGICIAKVFDTFKWRYDEALRILYIPTWWKYNPPQNPKHLIGCLKDLHELPQTELLKEFAANEQYLPDDCIQAFHIGMGIGIPIGMGAKKQKQKQESSAAEAAGAAPPLKKSPGDSDEPRKPRKQPAGDHHELIRFFMDGWRRKYGADYVFVEGKDGAAVQWILEKSGGIDAAKKIVESYLASDEPFVVDKHHPVSLLRSQINKFRGTPSHAAAGSNGARTVKF